ncbi:hypothetical protein IPM65_03550 [Candidatus Roizmanbacteria bacterium]|nr:MAG: hypothetical protein IPM65_03550 [Candidatus Roizmanbacteria bacterium]
MSDQKSYEGLFDLIYTSEQCNACINALQHALDASYDKNKDIMSVLDTYLPYNITNAILELAEENNIKLRDGESSNPFLTDIINMLKKAPKVDITLAFHPTYEQLKGILKWWRSEIEPHIILNLQIDPSLVAGAVIGYNGEITNLSLQEGLNTFLKKPN